MRSVPSKQHARRRCGSPSSAAGPSAPARSATCRSRTRRRCRASRPLAIERLMPRTACSVPTASGISTLQVPDRRERRSLNLRFSGAVTSRSAVAQQVDREHESEQRRAGHGDQPGLEQKIVLALRHHQAPGRRRRLHAEPEEGQGGLQQDRVRHLQRRDDDQVAQRRWAGSRRRRSAASSSRSRSRGGDVIEIAHLHAWRCA